MKNVAMGTLFLLLVMRAPFASCQDSLVTAIDRLLAAEFVNDKPGGAVLVARNGKILYKKAFGMANLELDVPNSENTVFYIASNTKQMTAVAILQLMEQGKLSLQDTMGKYAPCPPPASGITIRQLLSHTSGIVVNVTAPGFKETAGKPLTEFAPGTKWNYSNTGYSVLGYIIEKVSGQPYGEYIQEHIFKPAGMTSSWVANNDRLVKNRAAGYTNGKRGYRNMPLENPAGFYASGGVQSTILDMYRWNEALRSGVLLKKTTLDLAFTPQQLANGDSTTYGFGWHIWDLRGSKSCRHGGAVPGFFSETLYLPVEGIFVVILQNSESIAPIGAYTRIIASMMTGNPYSFRETAMSQKALQGFEGLYANQHRELVNITAAEGKLYFQRPGGMKYQVKAATDHEFFFDRDYLWLEFERNAAKQTTGLLFSKVGIGANYWKKTDQPALKLYPERFSDSLMTLYAGVYAFAKDDSVFVEKSGGTIVLKSAGKTTHTLVPQTERGFTTFPGNLHVVFETPEGQEGALVLQDGKTKKRARKIR
ncbi:class A beta-lactamase-related serine hydrolase [Chitinophaga lutea]|uniref:Class A beta-lactamase-related serine hydrolase n=1 Tax=Chitinophaga lutea TaxID=2488634 RepID=A0A3N4PJT8_9BACT|nr:serine hydrolase domain-containing protein [Chitinophaga lutea]RPE08085.1 class A beta-lactamase-related serine hydrolase [Chitinophaga lutea]